MLLMKELAHFVAAAAFLCFLGSGGARAQSTTTTPDDRNYTPNLYYQTAWDDYLATKKGKPVEIIFIGDSITEQWRWGAGRPVWQKFYAGRALNFGKGGDKTQHVLWRLENLDIKSFTPKVAVILIGTNNVSDAPEDIATGVKAVIDKTMQLFSGAKVVLISILPNARANEKMAATNAIIQKFADDKSVFFLDLVPSFPQEGDNWKGLSRDKLHLSTAGYQAWADALNPLLSKLGVSITAN